MDVRAKQRLSYQQLSFNLKLTSGGFAPRHLNRYIASEKFGLRFSERRGSGSAFREGRADLLKMTDDITNHCTRAATATLIKTFIVPPRELNRSASVFSVSMKKIFISSFIFLVLSSAGCAQTKTPSNSPAGSSNQESVDGSSIDQKKAREFSDSTVKTIIEDRQNELRQKMEQAFRDAVPEKEMKPMLEKVYSTYGKPLEVEFKMDETGYRIYDTGERKPMRKFWYSVRTTKQTKEPQFLFTEIVPDGDSLACVTFSIVTFPLGVPSGLK